MLVLLVSFSTLTFMPKEAAAAVDYEKQKPLRLYYDEEAPYGNETPAEIYDWKNYADDGWEKWSVPLGNGYMGVVVFGRTATERLQITENSMSTPYLGNSVGGGLTNFGEIYMDFGHTNSKVTNYSRDLLLDEGTAHVSYTYNGVNYSRELFASYPDKVTVVKLTADQAGKIDFTLRTEIPYLEDYYVDTEHDNAWRGKTGTVTSDGDTITWAGKFGAYEVKYEGQVKVIPEGGTVTASTDAKGNGCLKVSGANTAYVIIGVGTNHPVGDSAIFTAADIKTELAKYPAPHQKVTDLMAAASGKTYEQLLANHQADYKELFGRVKLDLGGTDGGKTTDQLVADYKKGTFNHYLEALYFQYGRYLLICSSRKGTLPPNLQGIWNRYKNPPWSAGYWHNINEQMNYWPVFNTNLAELFDCYVDYYNAYLPKAERDAANWMASAHPGNVNLPGGSGWSISTGAWPCSMYIPNGVGNNGNGTGALMAKSFSEYYAFTRNKAKLEEVLYPAVLGAAVFMTKVMEPHDGLLLADPSVSPEQPVNGKVSVGTGWDQQNAYEMHKDAIALAQVLGKENDPEVKMLEERIGKLDPVQVGASGQIKEYREENKYGEIGEYNHRHISHLVGLYPGTIINETTPAWFDAAAVTMTKRGDKSTGWAMAHRLNLWARTKRGERAYDLYRQLLRTGTNNNLWDVHPPFQIDGNLGGTAGVAEMLLQSHEGYIEPLAAIPSAWNTGSYSGLVARGNFEVAASWSGGQMNEIRVTSKAGEQCRLKYYNVGSATVTASDGSAVSVTKESDDLISFATKKGVSYTVSAIPNYTAVKAPSNLKAVTVENNLGKVNLSWSASADSGVTYSVYRAEESAPDYTLIAENVTGSSYTYTLPEASIGKQAIYRVAAVKNGRESKGTTVLVEKFVPELPSSVNGYFFRKGVLQVVCSPAKGASGYRLYEKRNGNWELLQTSPYATIIQEGANEETVYGISAIAGLEESRITEVKLSATDNKLQDNVLLNQKITGTKTALNGAQYAYSNAVDGDLSTRFAAVDNRNPNTVTVTLDGAYLLHTLRVYEFIPKEGGTRSDNTKVKVKENGSWKTVIEGKSLDVFTKAGQCTSIPLNNAIATELRITFENKNGAQAASASIWELQCSGIKLSQESVDVPVSNDNVLLNQKITGTKTAFQGAQYAYSNAVDGDLSTRFATVDNRSPNTVTVSLDDTYLLNTLRIYEFVPGEGGTRSDHTKVEVKENGSWKTVVEGKSLDVLTANGQCTSIPLNNVAATELRITFENKNGAKAASASIWELQCSGSKADEINLLLNRSISGTQTEAAGFSYRNAVDGDLSTVSKVEDSADPYSMTVDFEGLCLLGTLQIFEENDAAQTRSGKTKIEVKLNDTWQTVTDNLSLTNDFDAGTSVDMGSRLASALRLTFQNTSGEAKSAIIREIKCTGTAVAATSDKYTLNQALLRAASVDETQLNGAQKQAWQTALTRAQNAMNNPIVSKTEVTRAAEQLRELADEFSIISSIKPVTVTYTANGTVKVNGKDFISGKTEELDVTDGLTLTITPDSGYMISHVKVNGQPVIPQDDGTVFLSPVTGETRVEVVFDVYAERHPEVIAQPSSDIFTNINGTPTIYAYSKLNQFDTKETIAYGIRVWNKNNAAAVLQLPVRDPGNGEPAAAVPGHTYTIKMYGPAIVPEDTYVVQPYVGDATGEETELTYKE